MSLAAKSNKQSSSSDRRMWKRIALASLTANLLLVIALLSRGGVGSPDDQPEIDAFINRYFQTWSSQNIAGYRDCFHPRAAVHFIGADGVPQIWPLDPFIEGQAQVHAQAEVPLREIPTSKEIEVDGNIARALVRWKLFDGDREEVGTDYFTLLKTKTGWRIIGLVFRKDPS